LAACFNLTTLWLFGEDAAEEAADMDTAAAAAE
jgi:hypothetical protein